MDQQIWQDFVTPTMDKDVEDFMDRLQVKEKDRASFKEWVLLLIVKNIVDDREIRFPELWKKIENQATEMLKWEEIRKEVKDMLRG